MLTGTLIFFELNRRYSVLSGLTDSLFPIIHVKISLIQVSIDVKAEEANFECSLPISNNFINKFCVKNEKLN